VGGGPTPSTNVATGLTGRPCQQTSIVAQETSASDDASAPEGIAACKIHIRGLDNLSTDDVKALASEHYGPVKRVEWIDDESANLIFLSDSAAQDALLALSAVPMTDPTSLPLGETVLAKPLSSKPDVSLHIRLALLSDKKAPGAASRSRYYLFHPEQDPEERRRQREQRYRTRDRNDYRSGSHRRARDDDDVVETYHAAMYDDDEAALAGRATPPRSSRRSRSREIGDRFGERRRNQTKELFPDRKRNRSASPLRDGDGDARMDVATSGRGAGTSSNRRAASGLKDLLDVDDEPRELFPTKSKPPGGGYMDRLDVTEEATRLMEKGFTVEEQPRPDVHDSVSIKGAAERKGRQTGFAIKGAASAKVTELFPSKFGSNMGKELFANRSDANSRPRKKAEDLFN
jgi:hypothetical protein